MRKLLPIFVSCVMLSSCGPKMFNGLYTTPPTVQNAPVVTYLPERDVPAIQRKQLNIVLSEDVKLKEDDYFNNGVIRSKNGGAPSVLISVPDEAHSDKKENNGLVSKSSNDKSAIGEGYKTDGYYNEAEQAIEAALLRQGFNVLDRAKFEAKLRDLRDRANDKRYWWSNYDRLIENEDFDALKSLLEKQLLDGEITQSMYVERMSEVDQFSQIGLPGKNREEDEMNDIAEVIRAAQTGADQAEFLLQINGVAVSDAGDRMLMIKDLPAVKDFIADNEGLSFGSVPNALPASIPSRWLRADFNAKLISIQSGSIVWLGSHSLESWGAEPIQITFDVQRKVNNADVINTAIYNYNTKLRTLSNDLNDATVALKNAYSRASQQKAFDNEDEIIAYKAELQRDIESLQSKHTNLLNRLNLHMSQIPSEVNAPWEYVYIVSEPMIDPDILADSQKDIAGVQRLESHRKQLVRSVTQQLIRSIKVN